MLFNLPDSLSWYIVLSIVYPEKNIFFTLTIYFNKWRKRETTTRCHVKIDEHEF
jgi:hypothetical protein